jgi:hypothetical protein
MSDGDAGSKEGVRVNEAHQMDGVFGLASVALRLI